MDKQKSGVILGYVALVARWNPGVQADCLGRVGTMEIFEDFETALINAGGNAAKVMPIVGEGDDGR